MVVFRLMPAPRFTKWLGICNCNVSCNANVGRIMSGAVRMTLALSADFPHLSLYTTVCEEMIDMLLTNKLFLNTAFIQINDKTKMNFVNIARPAFEGIK